MKIKSWHNIKNIILFISAFFINCAFAAQEIDINAAGLVFDGYDPVAYHLSGQAMEGKESFEIKYLDGKMRFTSETNKDLFLANQDAYLPAYGGYCTYGVRVGKKFNDDPNTWIIKNNQLYFFLNDGTKVIWSKEEEKNLEISDRLWSKVKYKPLSIAE